MGDVRLDEPGHLTAVIIDGRVQIHRADPYVHLSSELVSLAAAGDMRHMTYDPETRALVVTDDFGASFTYRVGDLAHRRGTHACWEARWPD